jgi:hypothetical protein
MSDGNEDIQAPFIFVRHGDPRPEDWLREHPGAVRIPATFVPRPPDAAEQAARLWGPSQTPGSFAPVRRPGPWPVDRRGRPWPRTVFGQPQRRLGEFPPRQRAPGEAIPPEYRAAEFDITAFDPIGALRAIQAVLDDPAAAAGLRPARAKPTDGQHGLLTQVQATEPEEENRGLLEELTDATAELRIAQYNSAIRTLRQLDPNNSRLSSLASPGWTPSNETIATINAEIARASTQRVINFVTPAGQPIGVAGGGHDIRELPWRRRGRARGIRVFDCRRHKHHRSWLCRNLNSAARERWLCGFAVFGERAGT